MHFIEDKTQENKTQEQSPLHTSKRMHFIEDFVRSLDWSGRGFLAYVKTYALH